MMAVDDGCLGGRRCFSSTMVGSRFLLYFCCNPTVIRPGVLLLIALPFVVGDIFDDDEEYMPEGEAE